jgi:gluconolactonase
MEADMGGTMSMFRGVIVIASVLTLALCGIPALAQEGLLRGPIIVPDAKLEVVFDKGFWLEGPAVGPDDRIYFSDITMSFATKMSAGAIWVHDPVSNQTTLFRSPSGMANGIKFDRQGGMVVAQGADFGGRQVVRTDLSTGLSKIVAGLYQGRPFNSPNDLDVDRQGRIYFTDPRYFGHEPIEQPVFGVYRVDPDGTVALIAADVSRPNGIALSSDEKTLYVAENDIGMLDVRVRQTGLPTRLGAMRILAYDLDSAGKLSNPRVFVDYGNQAGADGIIADRDGNVYAAVQMAKGHGIRVYNASGTEIAALPTPIRPTNVTLATRSGKTTLYITAGTTLYRIATTVPARQ